MAQESIKVVEVTVVTEDGIPEIHARPSTEKIPYEWSGLVVWMLMTPGWRFADDGVQFRQDIPGWTRPELQLDGEHTDCFISSVSSKRPKGSWHYDLHIVSELANLNLHHDPVIENEAPPAPITGGSAARESDRTAV
ncbi:MAG TPA: hypothetical protein VFO89_03665 [Thermoanaerobaculia bacterium]|nr:hypothetical protein [Thermoanaerobaculia bacterium]